MHYAYARWDKCVQGTFSEYITAFNQLVGRHLIRKINGIKYF